MLYFDFSKTNNPEIHLLYFKCFLLFCLVQKKAVLEIGVNNPLNEEITLETEIVGQSLSGHPGITLPARAKGIYELDYFPAIVGTSEGRYEYLEKIVEKVSVQPLYIFYPWYMLIEYGLQSKCRHDHINLFQFLYVISILCDTSTCENCSYAWKKEILKIKY